MGTTLPRIEDSNRLETEAKGRALAAWLETFREYGRLGKVGAVVYDKSGVWVRINVAVDGVELPLRCHQASDSPKPVFYVEYPGLPRDAGRPLDPVQFTDPAGLGQALRQYREWEAGRNGQTVQLGGAAA